MDYRESKHKSEELQRKILKSELARRDLEQKFRELWIEKAECEKSIIKSLEEQQRKAMDEQRRRAERNDSIRRTLDRIDYQANVLAAKTERLKTVKKQYEQYLIRMWSSKKAIAYNTPHLSAVTSPAHSIRNFQLSSAFQPQEFTRFKSEFVHNMQEQQPTRQSYNLIPSKNYMSNMTPYHSQQTNFKQDIYPAYIPQESSQNQNLHYYQPQPFQHPTQPTMNYPVYNRNQLQHPPTASTVYASDIKSTKAFNPACKPLLANDINNMVKFDDVSTSAYNKMLNIPSTTEPKSPKKSKRFSVPNIMIHLSDDEEETVEKVLHMDQTNVDKLDKCELKLPATEFNNLTKIQAKSTTSIECNVKPLIIEQLYGAKEKQEKAVAGPFVIPKIIVEPQSELATSTPELAGQTHSLLWQSDNRVDSQPQVSAENVSMNYPTNANNSNNESSIEHFDKAPQNQQQATARQVNADLTENYENLYNSSVDDSVLHSSDLNDKISQIYQKIEKMEDKYYGEKVKIIENFGGLEQPPSDAPVFDEVLAVNVDDGNYVENQIEEQNIVAPTVSEQPQDFQGSSQEYVENFGNNEDNGNYDQYQPEVVENTENYPHYEYNATQPIYESQEFSALDEQANYIVPPIEITHADEEPQVHKDNPQEYYDPNYQQETQPDYDSNYLEPEYQQQDTQQYYQENLEPEYQSEASNSNYSQDNNNYSEIDPQFHTELSENQESQQPTEYEQPIEMTDSTDAINNDTNLSNEGVNLESNDEALYQPIELQDEQQALLSSTENYTPQLEETAQFAEEVFDIDTPQVQQPTELIAEPAEMNVQNYVDVEQTEEEYETEVDESFATTISSTETNKQHKALELDTAAASANDDVANEAQIKHQTDASPALDDVKMVKKLLDSESDESSIVQAPAKEIVDESDFEFSAAS